MVVPVEYLLEKGNPQSLSIKHTMGYLGLLASMEGRLGGPLSVVSRLLIFPAFWYV
jgi:hypothetical protein